MREFPFNGNLWRPWLPVFCQEWGSSRPFPACVIISRWWWSPLLWDFYHFLTLCKAHRGKSCPSYISLLYSVIIDYWLSLQGITWFKRFESLCSKICYLTVLTDENEIICTCARQSGFAESEREICLQVLSFPVSGCFRPLPIWVQCAGQMVQPGSVSGQGQL